MTNSLKWLHLILSNALSINFSLSGLLGAVDLGHIIQAKNENYFTKNDEKVSFSSTFISCIDEMAQINRIYISPTPGVSNTEKIMDKGFESIKYSHIKKVVIFRGDTPKPQVSSKTAQQYNFPFNSINLGAKQYILDAGVFKNGNNMQ